MLMDIVALTRQLVDIESITGNEATVGHIIEQELKKLGYNAGLMPVEGDRANVYATSPQEPNPTVVFSTHMDTVPPFIPSSEDRSEEHTSELQSHLNLVCRLLLEKKKT